MLGAMSFGARRGHIALYQLPLFTAAAAKQRGIQI